MLLTVATTESSTKISEAAAAARAVARLPLAQSRTRRKPISCVRSTTALLPSA
jgi:hypothetical protein